jgi:hypothetical protein
MGIACYDLDLDVGSHRVEVADRRAVGEEGRGTEVPELEGVEVPPQGPLGDGTGVNVRLQRVSHLPDPRCGACGDRNVGIQGPHGPDQAPSLGHEDLQSFSRPGLLLLHGVAS